MKTIHEAFFFNVKPSLKWSILLLIVVKMPVLWVKLPLNHVLKFAIHILSVYLYIKNFKQLK